MGKASDAEASLSDDDDEQSDSDGDDDDDGQSDSDRRDVACMKWILGEAEIESGDDVKFFKLIFRTLRILGRFHFATVPRAEFGVVGFDIAPRPGSTPNSSCSFVFLG